MLDFYKPSVSDSSQYWIIKYLFTYVKLGLSFLPLTFYRKFLIKREDFCKNRLLRNQKLYTIRYSNYNPSFLFSEDLKNFYKKVFKTKYKVKNRLLYSKHIGKEVYDFLSNPKLKFDEKYLKRLIKNFKNRFNVSIFRSKILWSFFDINFLKKEKIYTKLKYSRVPQYDIVSGGSAALLAGFLGFLISEKFGFELVDSGDFYFLFMYVVFLSFSLRPFIRIINISENSWNPFSSKWLIVFYQTLVFLFSKFIKKISKIYWNK
jgi:hypothetical protein